MKNIIDNGNQNMICQPLKLNLYKKWFDQYFLIGKTGNQILHHLMENLQKLQKELLFILQHKLIIIKQKKSTQQIQIIANMSTKKRNAYGCLNIVFKKQLQIMLLFSCLVLISTNQLLIPKTIWIYWDGPIQNAPIIVQMCIQKIKITCESQKWTFIQLGNHNLQNYISHYQDQFLEVAKHTTHPQWKSTFADLLRLYVLDEHGGVWIDVSTILYEGLSWLQNLDKFPYLFTNSNIQNGEQPDVILPYVSVYQNSAQCRDSNGKITNYFPGYEVWFIAAIKQSNLIAEWRKRYLKLFQSATQQNQRQEITNHYYLRFVSGDYLKLQKTVYEVIQQAQRELDRNLTLFGERKNANKQFKILAFHGQYGPLSLFLQQTPSFDTFLTHTIEQIELKYSISINFFIKLTNRDRPHFEDVLRRLSKLSKRFGTERQTFEMFMDSIPSQKQCNEIKFIVQGSVFSRLIEGNKIAAQLGLQVVSLQQRDRWQSYCRQAYNTRDEGVILRPDIQQRIVRVVNLEYFQGILQKQTKDKIVLFFVKCFTIASQFGAVALFSDYIEVNYWKKYYQQKELQTSNDGNGLQQFVSIKTKYYHYSWLELWFFKLKLKLLNHKMNILIYMLKFCSFTILLFILGIVSIAISFITKFVFSIIKYNVHPLVWIYTNFLQAYRENSFRNPLNILFDKISILFSVLNLNSIVYFLRSALGFIYRKMIALIIGIIIIAWNTFIIFQYYSITLIGQIYYQEVLFLFIITINILVKKINKKLSKNTRILPGLQLDFIQRIFSTIFYFYFGSSILSLGEVIQAENFGLAFFLCFCLPAAIKLIQFQVRKNYRQQLACSLQKKSFFKSLFCYIMEKLSNLTSLIQKVIFIFLIINVVLPNFRFLVYGQKYWLQTFFIYLTKSKYIFFCVLVSLYAHQVYRTFQMLIRNKQNNNKTIDDQKLSSNRVEQVPNSALSQINTTNSDSLDLKDHKKQLQQKISLFKYLSALILTFKYVLRLYVFYSFLFDSNQQYLLKNLRSTSLQSGQSHLVRRSLQMLVLIMICFVNFQLQRYLDEIFCQIRGKYQEGRQCPSQSGQQVQQYKAINARQQEGLSMNIIERSLGKVSIFIDISQIAIFLIPRLLMIKTVYQFYKAIDNKDLNQIQQLQSLLGYNFIMMGMLTLGGFLVVKEVLENWVKKISFENDKSKMANYNELVLTSATIEFQQRQIELPHY